MKEDTRTTPILRIATCFSSQLTLIHNHRHQSKEYHTTVPCLSPSCKMKNETSKIKVSKQKDEHLTTMVEDSNS